MAKKVQIPLDENSSASQYPKAKSQHKRSFPGRILRYGIIGFVGLVVISLLFQALGITPSTEELNMTRTIEAEIEQQGFGTSTAVAVAQIQTEDAILMRETQTVQAAINATETIIAQTPTVTDTVIPSATETDEPTATMTVTLSSTPTITETSSPSSTATTTQTSSPIPTVTSTPTLASGESLQARIERRAFEVQGVESIISLNTLELPEGGYSVEGEFTVSPGFNAVNTAQNLQSLIVALTEREDLNSFVIVLVDNRGSTNYTWSADLNEWTVVEVSPTAVPVVQPTAIPTAVPVVQPTAIPTAVPVVQPTLPPPVVVQTIIPVQPPSGEVCPNIGATCPQLTCPQAYACLAAGNDNLDKDSDGVPCESICPGG